MKAYVRQVDTGETIVSEHTTKERALNETALCVGDLIQHALEHNLSAEFVVSPDNVVSGRMSDSSEWYLWVE